MQANYDAVFNSGWTVYLEHGGDRQVLDRFLSREAAHGNLAVLSSMCRSVLTSIRAMPPEQRHRSATTVALENCLPQTELDGYRRACGELQLGHTSAVVYTWQLSAVKLTERHIEFMSGIFTHAYSRH